jgi:hypothetical protein
MSTSPGYRPDQIIKDAAKHGELVVFVGAGASMLCGSPDWRGFANAVGAQLEKAGALTFLAAEQLRGMGDSRRTLSIAMGLARELSIDINFDGILHPERPQQVGLELYDLLASLRPVFVTTNYDKWLDEAGPREATAERPPGSEAQPPERPASRAKYYLPEHLTSDRLAERGAVVHLHGSYTDPKSMVVSLRGYIEHYADERVQTFLAEMFKNYTVLFVGYGLAELEVLEHIIRSNESLASPGVEPRHFIIYAHRSTELVQTEFTERYFRDQCGVQVIRYCIDNRGYTELLDVFKAWQPELDVRDPSTLDLQNHLDRCVADSTVSRRESALRLVDRNPGLAAYFLNSLNDAVWFQDLVRQGFFDPKDSPALKQVETAQGKAYQAEGWPALRYLERIASRLSGDKAATAIDLVRVVNADSVLRTLNNWRTSWSLATIVSQLPTELLTSADFEMMRGWLLGPFDSSMVGAELGRRLLPRLLQTDIPGGEEKALMLVNVLTTPRPREGS